jgi:hypothetical protein
MGDVFFFSTRPGAIIVLFGCKSLLGTKKGLGPMCFLFFLCKHNSTGLESREIWAWTSDSVAHTTGRGLQG